MLDVECDFISRIKESLLPPLLAIESRALNCNNLPKVTVFQCEIYLNIVFYTLKLKLSFYSTYNVYFFIGY